MTRVREYSAQGLRLLPKAALLVLLASIFSSILFYNINDPLTRSFPPPLHDGITILLITFLLVLELSIPVFGLHKQVESTSPKYSGAISNISFKAMRPAIFVFLFGIDLTISILPLQMERLYEPLFGFSKEFVSALPIALEFLCVGIALLISGAWLDRRGWAEPFLVGILLTAFGCLLSWLATDAIQFLLSRVVLGFGYGLTLLAAQGFVISNTDIKNKAQGLAHLFAGLYSGSICGAATGAIFAERYGYEVVFLAGALITLSVIIYALFYLNLFQHITQRFASISARTRTDSSNTADTELATCVGEEKNTQNKRRYHTVIEFLLDKRVIAVTLLSSLPASIAVIGFLHFFTPVYLSQNGVSESEIGQVLMLFGLCLTLLGPSIGKQVDRVSDKKTSILVGGVLGAGAFLLFDFNQGVMAATVAVILLGLSNSFVLSAQSAYVLQLDISKKLGEGKALGIFRATSRLGQMLGPLIFAGLLSMSSPSKGVVWFGAIYLLLVLLFQVMARTRTPNQYDTDQHEPKQAKAASDLVQSVSDSSNSSTKTSTDNANNSTNGRTVKSWTS